MSTETSLRSFAGLAKEVSTAILWNEETMAGKKKPQAITRKLPDPVETRMRELFDARLNVEDKPMSREELAAALAAKPTFVLPITGPHRRRADRAGRPGISPCFRSPALQWCRSHDVAASLRKGIAVTNTPNVLFTEDTADMTVALMLAVPRRPAEGLNVLTGDKKWPGWSPTWRRRIWGKRLGIVSMGRIAVARRAKASPPSTITTGTGFCSVEDELRRPIGKASTRCWPAWTSSVNFALDAGGHLPSPVRLAVGAAAAYGLHRQYGARRHHRRGCAGSSCCRMARSSGAVSTAYENEPVLNTASLEARRKAQGGAAAA